MPLKGTLSSRAHQESSSTAGGCIRGGSSVGRACVSHCPVYLLLLTGIKYENLHTCSNNHYVSCEVFIPLAQCDSGL